MLEVEDDDPAVLVRRICPGDFPLELVVAATAMAAAAIATGDPKAGWAAAAESAAKIEQESHFRARVPFIQSAPFFPPAPLWNSWKQITSLKIRLISVNPIDWWKGTDEKFPVHSVTQLQAGTTELVQAVSEPQ